MIRRSMVVGIVGGIIISLSGVYPVVSLLTPLWLDGWQRPLPDDLTHGIWLMVSAALFVPTVLFLGLFAARRAHARGFREGAKAGMIAGLAAGGILYFALIAPINALIAFGTVGSELDVLADSYLPSPDVLASYVVSFQNVTLQVELILILSALFWGAQGAIVGWLRRKMPREPRPSLYQLVEQGEPPKEYFAGDETAVQTGLLVGILVGILSILTASGLSYLVVAGDWPELLEALQESHAGIIVSAPLFGASALLSPLFAIGLLGFGILVVALVKNPPDWFRARTLGIMTAGMTIFLALFAIGLRFFYFNLGLAPFWVLRELQLHPSEMAREQTMAVINFFIQTFQSPEALIAAVLVIPWMFMATAVIIGLIFSFLQAIIVIPILSMLHKRPVDRALMALRQLKKDPNDILPGTYQMFSKDAQAYDVLAHITVRLWKREPELAGFAAAYHTLGTSPQEAEYTDTIEMIRDTLAGHREWRWSLDFAGAYNTLAQVMNARTLEQILAIEPPPEQHTSSLPPLVVKSQQRLGRIVKELQKVERTDDLATKLIFLENTLSTIHETQGFVQKEFTDPEQWATPLPQYKALGAALNHWEATLLTAVQRLKGRADVIAGLKANHCTFLPELPVAMSIRNQGLNVAQAVRLRLLPGDGYDLLGVKSEGTIEILAPGEEKEFNLFIMPHDEQKGVRLAWEVIYDDAVDAERHIAFGDKLEFVTPDRPFMRIFPIPYVTGTPLKTDDVFVGREDVFGFVQEMLVGAHQNNMVILHGQRRTGKTSVLYRMHDLLAETHYTVLVDMQGKPARGEAEFLYSIADDIVFTLEDEGINVELPPRSEFEENPEFFFRSRFVRSLRPHLNGKHLLLMFDEFEELQRRVEEGRLQPEIFQFLRNMMQHEEQVDFIFAGTHKLEELGSEYWSALFNIAAYRPITFLRSREMRHLILDPIKEFNTEYDPLAVERIIKVTAGHPYFAQLLLHEMMVYHNEMQASYLTAVDVDQVIERIIGRGEAHFRYIWDESSEEERLVLQAMAELLVGQDSVAAKDLRSFLTERGLQSADRWKKALRILEGRDILTTTDEKNTLYRYKVDLIRSWVVQTRQNPNFTGAR